MCYLHVTRQGSTRSVRVTGGVFGRGSVSGEGSTSGALCKVQGSCFVKTKFRVQLVTRRWPFFRPSLFRRGRARRRLSNTWIQLLGHERPRADGRRRHPTWLSPVAQVAQVTEVRQPVPLTSADLRFPRLGDRMEREVSSISVGEPSFSSLVDLSVSLCLTLRCPCPCVWPSHNESPAAVGCRAGSRAERERPQTRARARDVNPKCSPLWVCAT